MASSNSRRGDGQSIGEYQEFGYPHVRPENDVLDTTPGVSLAELTPLEATFIRWMVVDDDPDKALSSLIHPAYPFDVTASKPADLMARSLVVVTLDKIRKKSPYASRYTRDYTLGLLHDEIEYLRAKNRRPRYDDSSYVERVCGDSKKSVREHEVADTLLLIDLLKLVITLNTAQPDDAPNVPSPKPGDPDSRIDGLLTATQKRIRGEPVGNGGPTPPGAA